jgi:hypothetical protein
MSSVTERPWDEDARPPGIEGAIGARSKRALLVFPTFISGSDIALFHW